ncbi:hypothetical protein GF389_05300 [Candidatus Dojkabacteria bacterium]|nr:hypothetical protein [Candidatus Dojkabacteria bacterium]
MEQLDPIASELLSDLAVMGRGITQAYSEGNQDLGGELMMAKSIVSKWRTKFETMGLSPSDTKGLSKLLDYFDKKIQRRLDGGVDKPF